MTAGRQAIKYGDIFAGLWGGVIPGLLFGGALDVYHALSNKNGSFPCPPLFLGFIVGMISALIYSLVIKHEWKLEWVFMVHFTLSVWYFFGMATCAFNNHEVLFISCTIFMGIYLFAANARDTCKVA